MSKDLGMLIAQIGADMRQWEQSMQQMQQDMRRAEDVGQASAERIAQSFEQAGRRMQKVGKSMSRYITLPLSVIGGFAVKTAMDFEASMNQVSAVSGATGEDLRQLEGVARDLGATTKFSATEAAEGMGFLAMAGFEVNEIMNALPATLNLAAAGNMALGESADIVSNIMQGFQIDAMDTAEVTDILTHTFTTSNTNLLQLGDAMKYVAPVAHGFGQTIETTAAAVGFLSDAGMQAGMAGTGLRRVISALAERGEDLGVTIFDAAGNMLPFADILEQLEERGLTAAEAMDVFGQRGGPAMMTLLARGSKALREVEKDLQEAGGTAQRVADTQMQGLKGTLIEVRSALQEVAISMMDPFMEMLDGVATKVRDAARWLGNLDEGTRKLIVQVAAFAAVAGPALVIIGKMSIGIGALIRATRSLVVVKKAMTAVVAASRAVFMTHPIFFLAGVAAAAAAAIWGLSQAFQSASAEQQALNNVQERVNSEMDSQAATITRLTSIIENNNMPLKARKDAIKELNQLVPEYNAHLTKEGELIGHNTGALDDYMKRLREKITLQAYEEEIQSAIKEEIRLRRELESAQQEFAKGQMEGLSWIERVTRSTSVGAGVLDTYNWAFRKGVWEIKDYSDELNDTINTLSVLEREMQEHIQGMKLGQEKTEGSANSQDEYNEKVGEGTQMVADYTDALKELSQAQLEASMAKDFNEAEKSLENFILQVDNASTRSFPSLEETMFNVRKEMGYINRMNAALGDEFDEGAAKIRTYQQALGTLIQQGYMPGNEAVDELRNKLMQLKGEMGDTQGGVNQFAVTMESGLARSAASFSSMVGEVMAGTATMKGAFHGLLDTLLGVLQQLGELAIATGVTASGIQKALKGYPVAAIAAGAALIALTSMVRSRLASLADQVGAGGGGEHYQGLSSGGKITRSGMFTVGETGKENVFLPAGAAVHPIGASTEKRQLVVRQERDYMEIWLEEGKQRRERTV